MVEEFNPIENRDAWSTIRGFVYQVDLTILRWLNLRDDEILELETGEDIDIVSTSLEKRDIRELEQVKYRESNITLSVPSVLECIKNYYIHRKNNPNIRIHFRFVTNSNYGTERPEIFEGGKSAIEVWINIKNIDAEKDVQVIKSHLLSKAVKTVESDRNPQWVEFKEYLETCTFIEFKEFIDSFEWALNNDDNETIAVTNRNILVEKGYSNSKELANALYGRLFLHTFKLLCQKSSKQLNRAELINQTKLTSLSKDDEELLSLLEKIVKDHDRRLDKLEKKVDDINADVLALVKGSLTISDSEAIFGYEIMNLPVAPPAKIINGCSRTQRIDKMIDDFDQICWLALSGINGTGKSQFAVSISERFNNTFWCELRTVNKDENKARILIEIFLTQISNVKLISDRNNWLNEVAKHIPENTILVLNDIPRTDHNSKLAELLILISQAFRKFNLKLITTSNFPINNRIKQSVTDNSFQEISNLDFSDEEITEYLKNNSAPTAIFSYINVIASITDRNPSLVSSIIYHLKNINWGADKGQVTDVMLNSEFKKEVLADTQESIRTLINNPHVRELLYRLSIIPWSFDSKEVMAVSGVPQAIEYPNEKLSEVVHVWIQQLSNNRYQVSPLIKDIGLVNLEEKAVRSIRLVLANSILSTGQLNQVTAYRAISLFIEGKDYDQAGATLILVLSSAKSLHEYKELKDWGYTDLWALGIPREMSVLTKAYIRNEQIRIRTHLGEESEKYYRDILEYSKSDGLSDVEDVLINIFLSYYSAEKDLINFWDQFLKVLTKLQIIPDQFREGINFKVMSNLLWIPIKNLRSVLDIKKWLEAISLAEKLGAINFFDDEVSQQAIAALSGYIVQDINSSPTDQRDMQQALDKLTIIQEYFVGRGLEVLETLVLKEIVGLIFKEDQTKAIDLVNKKISELNSDEAKYFLLEHIGKLIFNVPDKEASVTWLLGAISINCEDQPNYIDTLLYAACAVSEKDAKSASAFLLRAVDIADKRVAYFELDYIKLLGELAISYWINTDYTNALLTFEKVITRLLEYKASDEAYRTRLIVWSGHILGYISSWVNLERIPERTSDGGAYTKPYQGMYLFNTKDVSDLIQTKTTPIILSYLAVFADGVGDIKKAYYWSLKAFDIARRDGDEKTIMMISAMCSQYSVVNFKLAEAFEAYLLFSVISVSLKGKLPERFESLGSFNYREKLDAKPSQNWNAAEDLTMLFAVIPPFIAILTDLIENTEGKSIKLHEFREMVKDYQPKASNPELWIKIEYLFNGIISKELNENALVGLSNKFAAENLQNLQVMCLLGLLLHNKKENAAEQLLNVVPILSNQYSLTTRSILKYILVPFIKAVSSGIIESNYVGNKVDMEEFKTKIKAVDEQNLRAPQLILQIMVDALDIAVSENRREWLFNYKEFK